MNMQAFDAQSMDPTNPPMDPVTPAEPMGEPAQQPAAEPTPSEGSDTSAAA